MRRKGRKIMTLKKISKADVLELLECCAKTWKTYVPLETEGKDILFSLLPTSGSELKEALGKVNLNDERVIISPKDIFFPQLDDMFYFDKDKIKENVEPPAKKLIFGVKPCDAKAINFVDEFFKRNFEDIYYLSRTKDRLIVVIGCITPPRPDACFCTSAKTGPFANDGYDLQLVDIGDEYFVEVGSSEGENFINSYSDFFKDAQEEKLVKAQVVKSQAAKNVKLKVDFQKALEIMKGNKDLEENYKRISERCIYCGGCVYVCPTCTCFNVFDEKKDGNGIRRKNWDACVFEGYTREASGHNPRDKKVQRTARRYEHKLKYDYKVTGSSGCTACGRCLSSCPVEIGMHKFIQEITEDKKGA